MLLAVNIGNTNTYFGFFDNKKLLATLRLPTDPKRNQDEYTALLQQFFSQRNYTFNHITDVVIGSVVPKATPKLEAFIKQKFPLKPLFVSGKNKLPIKLTVNNPERVGVDIIANLVAAHEIYGGKILVVDFGTATTFNLISEKGSYLGSVIAPGLEVMTGYLPQKTALLPKISFDKPKKVIGKNTINCMRSGIFYGYTGLVEAIIKNIKKEHGRLKIIATGGNSAMLANEVSGIDYINETLTLQGLRIIFQHATSE